MKEITYEAYQERFMEKMKPYKNRVPEFRGEDFIFGSYIGQIVMKELEKEQIKKAIELFPIEPQTKKIFEFDPILNVEDLMETAYINKVKEDFKKSVESMPVEMNFDRAYHVRKRAEEKESLRKEVEAAKETIRELYEDIRDKNLKILELEQTIREGAGNL